MTEDSRICIKTWQDIERATDKLYHKIKHRKYDAILAVSRGGLIPATLLAYNLDIKKVTSIAVRTYDDTNVKLLDFSILSQPDFDIIVGNVLVVDDLIETGETIKIIRNLDYNNDVKLDFAVLFSKGLNDNVDYFGEVVDDFQWINFPWDE